MGFLVVLEWVEDSELGWWFAATTLGTGYFLSAS